MCLHGCSLAGGMEAMPITDPAARATPLEPAAWRDMIAQAEVRIWGGERGRLGAGRGGWGRQGAGGGGRGRAGAAAIGRREGGRAGG